MPAVALRTHRSVEGRPGVSGWELVAAIVAAATAVVAGALTIVREVLAQRGRVAAIKDRLALVEALPADSSARKSLQEHVDKMVDQLITVDADHRRNPTIGITGLLFLTVATWLGWWARDAGLWGLWLPAAVVGVLGLAMAGDGFSKAERTPTGTRVRKPRPSSSPPVRTKTGSR
jgi:hypothetical protein